MSTCNVVALVEFYVKSNGIVTGIGEARCHAGTGSEQVQHIVNFLCLHGVDDLLELCLMTLCFEPPAYKPQQCWTKTIYKKTCTESMLQIDNPTQVHETGKISNLGKIVQNCPNRFLEKKQDTQIHQ